MSLNLSLFRIVNGKRLVEAPLRQTPSNVTLSILPSRLAPNLQPTLEKYVAWVKSEDKFVPPNTASQRATLKALQDQKADPADIQLLEDEIKFLTTSPAQEHLEQLHSFISVTAQSSEGGSWTWMAC